MAKIILQNVRMSYVNLLSPRKNEDGSDGKYGVQLIIPKDDPQVKKLISVVKSALEDKFGADAWEKRKRFKLPLRDGDEEQDGEEYAGCYFLNVNGNRKPGIVNKNGEPADPDDLEEYCYSGAYAHVSFNTYGFAVDGNKGVACGLNNVMLRKKGDRLDGSVSAANEFSEYTEDDKGDEDFDDEL